MNNEEAYDLVEKTGITCLKLEKCISKDYFYSYFYAKLMNKGRFKLGEKAIGKFIIFFSHTKLESTSYLYFTELLGFNHD